MSNTQQIVRLLKELYPNVSESKLHYHYYEMINEGWEARYGEHDGKHAVCIYQLQRRCRGDVVFIDSLVSDGGGHGDALLKLIHKQYEGFEFELRCPLQRSQAQAWYHKKGFSITGFTMGK